MSLIWLTVAGIATSLLIEALPTTPNGECVDSCAYDNICFPEGQTWTDSSVPGCIQFQCLQVVDDSNNSTAYIIGSLGCPQIQPPADGSPYTTYYGDSTAAYPECCPQYVILQESKQDSGSSSPANKNGKKDK